MPYINKKARDELQIRRAVNAGELNYVITQIIIEYYQGRPLTYAIINDIIGALESSKLEFYRRVVSHHEHVKEQINGDVYPVTSRSAYDEE